MFLTDHFLEIAQCHFMEKNWQCNECKAVIASSLYTAVAEAILTDIVKFLYHQSEYTLFYKFML